MISTMRERKTNARLEDIGVVPALEDVLGGTTDAREPDAGRQLRRSAGGRSQETRPESFSTKSETELCIASPEENVSDRGRFF
jgi:hypothetical protein